MKKKRKTKFDPICDDCKHLKSKHLVTFKGYPNKLVCYEKISSVSLARDLDGRAVCWCDEFILSNLSYLEQLYDKSC
jgi:hypothetical protein